MGPAGQANKECYSHTTYIQPCTQLQQGLTPKECILNGTTDCQALRVAFFECKRSLVCQLFVQMNYEYCSANNYVLSSSLCAVRQQSKI